MAFLKVISNGEERTVFLADQPVILGRGQDADILLKDAKASRHHCVIEPADGGWVARDLGSGNGTRLNGQKIAVRTLTPDDVLKIGDARIVFAGEAVAVVVDDTPAEAEPRTAGTDGDVSGPRRSRTERPAATSRLPLIAGLGVLALIVSLVAWKAMGGSGDTAEARALSAFRSARTDNDIVTLGSRFLDAHIGSADAGEVRTAMRAARARLNSKGDDEYDPGVEIKGLAREAAIAKLQLLLKSAEPNRRPKLRALLTRLREADSKKRDAFFAAIESDFRAHVRRGEFARARQIWFFLAGDAAWRPIPRRYLDKIVAANGDLETAAVAARAKLLDNTSRYEAAYRFKEAVAMLRRDLPRFAGTSVERSLTDRIATYQAALANGVNKRASKTPGSLVRLDVGKEMTALLKRLPQRDFTAVAAGLRKLASTAQRTDDPGYAEIAARARECTAVVAVKKAVVDALVAGRVPRKVLARRWRVLRGDAAGTTVRVKGKEQTLLWAKVPPRLLLALMERQAASVPNGWLGLVTAAHAMENEPGALRTLTMAYEKSRNRAALDGFVAARLRHEPLPDGGYVVHEGKLLTRREFVRQREEELIATLKVQLAKSYEAILKDKTFRGFKKMNLRMAALDKSRAYALALIFDSKKYFYPYRGTGREGEYWPVQSEVDGRVAAVREIWDDPRKVSVKKSRSLTKTLEKFDQAARELDKRLVDVEKEVAHVAFLRAYVGHKFTIRTFFRDADEMRLLLYSKEVMEANPTVAGDIRATEREQVRVTNEYRMMFGRRAVRLVDKLVLSSRGHGEEMGRLGYFSHYSPTPGRRSPGDRMRLAGYTYGVSENIAAGASAPLGAHKQWCHSSGHHRNILTAGWTEMGTGHHGRLWTQNFGIAPVWSKEDQKPTDGDDRDGDGMDGRDDTDGDESDGDDDSDDKDGFDYGDG